MTIKESKLAEAALSHGFFGPYAYVKPYLSLLLGREVTKEEVDCLLGYKGV